MNPSNLKQLSFANDPKFRLALILIYFAQWLLQKICTTILSDQIQIKTAFSRALSGLFVFIGSLWYFALFWLAIAFTLVLGFATLNCCSIHGIEITCN